MEIKTSIHNEGIQVDYILNEKEKQIMSFVKENNYIEFRSRKETDSSGQFLEEDCEELIREGFLDYDYDSWHNTLVLDRLGKRYTTS